MKTKTTRTGLGIALTLILLLMVGMGLGTGVAYADDGDLDFSFGGGDGLVNTNLQDTVDEAHAVAMQADGKIVAVGFTHITGTNYNFSVARYNADGSLDTTFGGGLGKLTTDFYGRDDRAYGVAIDSDGRIVVVGTSGPYGPNGNAYAFAAARYQPNGSLDASFSSDGRVTWCFRDDWCYDNDPQTSVAQGVAIQADGKIMLAGSANHESSPNFGLMRLLYNGELDGSFDGDGKLTTNFFGGVDEARAVAIQPDGKIVAAGNAQVDGFNYDFAFARYNANGSLDGSFSSDGKANVEFFGGDDGAYALALQPDGKLVAAGAAYYDPSSYNFGVARLLANGTLDSGFGDGGIKAEDLGGQGGGQLIDVALGMAIESDGKIVTAGYAPANGVNRFALARFNPDGFLDSTFGGGDGWLTTDFGGGVALGFGVAIQPDGKIVTVGTAYMGEPHSYDYAVARYLSGGISNPTPTAIVTATPTSCTIQFTDVPAGSTFYDYVRCLACREIISGYPDGTFRPGNSVTRGQLAKIVSNSAGYNEPHPGQSFEDVPVGSPFHLFIERLFTRGYISGYACGGAGEPCVPPVNRPYFRPGANVTRGQTAKIVASAAGLPAPPPGLWTFQDVPQGSTFWEWIEGLSSSGAISGYPCGGPAEPCVPPENRYYFRPFNNVTRGQSAKIVANTFFPGCQTAASVRK